MKITTKYYTLSLILLFPPISLCFAEYNPVGISEKPVFVKKQKIKTVEKIIKKKAEEKNRTKIKEKKTEEIVLGKNLKVGMNINKAIKILGVPPKVKVQRGTEPSLDSISIEYE